MDELIMAYVPYAEMSHAEAARLAVERDQQAAKELAESAETQLRMEQAAKLLAEMGHLADCPLVRDWAAECQRYPPFGRNPGAGPGCPGFLLYEAT